MTQPYGWTTFLLLRFPYLSLCPLFTTTLVLNAD